MVSSRRGLSCSSPYSSPGPRFLLRFFYVLQMAPLLSKLRNAKLNSSARLFCSDADNAASDPRLTTAVFLVTRVQDLLLQ